MQCQPENNLTTKPTKFSKQLDLKVLKEFHLEVILLGEGLVQPAAEILQRVLLYYLLFQQNLEKQLDIHNNNVIISYNFCRYKLSKTYLFNDVQQVH